MAHSCPSLSLVRALFARVLILFVLVLPAVIGAADYPNAVLLDEPAGYWRMEETEGAVAADASGNGIHGTYACNTGDQWLPVLGQASATPALGRAVNLRNGALGYVLVDDARFQWAGAGAVEAWIKVADDGYGSQRIVSTEEYGGQAGWALRLDGSNADGWTLSLAIAGRSSYSIPQATVTGNTWHHVVVSISAARAASFYIDGVHVGDAGGVATPEPGTAGMRIGSPGTPKWSGNSVLFGLVDEVAYHDHELPPERVAAHFEAADYTPPEGDPAAWAKAVTVAAGRRPYTSETDGHIVVSLVTGVEMYPTEINGFNSIRFEPVTTPALRIRMQLQPEMTAGIYE